MNLIVRWEVRSSDLECKSKVKDVPGSVLYSEPRKLTQVHYHLVLCELRVWLVRGLEISGSLQAQGRTFDGLYYHADDPICHNRAFVIGTDLMPNEHHEH